jgi:predicted ATPase
MLMDLFYKNLDFFPKKKRAHFHEYMIDVHQRLFTMQQRDSGRMQKCDTHWTAASAEAQRKSLNSAATGSGGDIVERVADELLAEAELLCFDEFQVTNISDAVIMRRLFSILFEKGMVMVATSNRPPDDLYLNGLNRELFTPFIPLLKQYCTVHNMDSATDYRQLTSGGDQDTYKVFFAPLNENVQAHLESKFFHMAQNEIDFDSVSIEVQGRCVSIRRAAKQSSIAWFTFKELCDKPLGSADYIKIAKRFHTVFLEGVPELTLQERDQVRRFITLIDALYDNGTRLVFSAGAKLLNEIFTVDEATKKSSSVDEIFAWDRTVSRLTEMTSIEYLIRHIRRLSAEEFFGQFDLDASQLSESDLRQIFVRYDKNNDAIIAVVGLNRMVNDLGKVVGSGGERTASPALIEKLSKDGRRVHFEAFKELVNKNGLVSGLLKTF